MKIDHDRLFQELISTFFIEFLELFLPRVARDIDRDSIQFLPQEVFTDVTSGDKKEIDLLVKVKYQQQDAYFLIHIENQAFKNNIDRMGLSDDEQEKYMEIVTSWEREGIEKGIEEATERIAINLLREGATFEFVTKVTGLTTEQVRELQAQLQKET